MSPPTADAPELVFAPAVEGLFRVGLRDRVTPALAERLRAAGLDLSRPLLPAYPRALWVHVIQLAAASLGPADDPPRALHALGRRMVEGYTETLIGRAMVSVIRLLGPRRVLDRMQHTLRSGGNFNRTRVTELAPRDVLFWLNEPYVDPAYVRGMLERTLEYAGARGLDVAVHARDAEGCTYRVRWEG